MDNRVAVDIQTESGCDPKKGEYSLSIVSMLQPLIVDDNVGDAQLIKECIEEAIGEHPLPVEGLAQARLKETGEWEDVFWHKYYVVEEWEIAYDHAEEERSSE